MPGTLLFVKRRQLSIPQLQLHGVRRTLCSEEFSRDVESFASNYDDFLAVEQLLGYSASQAAQEMSLAINDDLHRPASVHISLLATMRVLLIGVSHTTDSKVDILDAHSKKLTVF